MYKVDDLIKYPYFKDLLQKNKIEYVLDPLSGVVNRKYIAEFVMDIFAKKIPFRLAILDLDDFKLINDKYGHLVGDNVLEGLGNDLINYVGENGIAGRFGGDEFIILHQHKNMAELENDVIIVKDGNEVRGDKAISDFATSKSRLVAKNGGRIFGKLIEGSFKKNANGN